MIYALISTAAPPTTLRRIHILNAEKKDFTKQKFAASTLSLSKRIIVFKSKKELKVKGKLVQIFQEYSPPSILKIDEITSDLYDKAPGFEEIKAIILDELFSAKKEDKITFGLSFYDFEYLQSGFVNALGARIKNDLKKQGVKANFISVAKNTFLSENKAKMLKNEGLEMVIIKKSVPPLSIYLGKVLKCC